MAAGPYYGRLACDPPTQIEAQKCYLVYVAEPERLLGARALGLRLDWRYRFVPPATRAESTPGVLYLDVGGGLRPGIIDHHGDDSRPTSTAELILQHRELVYVHLLGPALQRATAGESLKGTHIQLTLVTHYNPDFDGVVSTYFVRHLLEHGDLPPSAAALARYVTDVDQGRYRVSLDQPATFFAPHIGHLALQNLPTKGTLHDRSLKGLETGLSLVERVLSDVGETRRAHDFVPHGDDHPATRWSTDNRFEGARELLDAEPERFREDKSKARLTETRLPIRNGGGSVAVPTFIATAPPESRLNKYWVRASGYPFFICPYATDVDEDGRYGRVVLSLDPVWEVDGQLPSLRALGFALEQREVEVRNAAGGDERPPSPRRSDGTCNNSDPWYDGRGHDFTIVDAPASSTHLAYDEVIDIACSGRFWHVPLARGTITMMWTSDLDEKGDAAKSLKGAWAPLERPHSIDDRMAPFYASCRALPLTDTELDRPGVRARREVRDFPPEARGGLELLHVEAKPGATLEQLLEGMQAAIEVWGEPAYSLSRIALAPHNTDPKGLDALIHQLGDVDVDEMPLGGDELVLFNHRSLLVRGAGERKDDGYLEVFFYLAFVREALRDYRTRLSDLLRKKNRSKKDTEMLRRDVLAFQTRYYDLEIASTGRGRKVAERLVDAMHLPRSYGEIQDQMRQLAQLEARADSRHREKADFFMESALFFVAVAGVFETIVAFLSWEDFRFRDWYWIGGIIAFFIAIWLLFVRMRARRRA